MSIALNAATREFDGEFYHNWGDLAPIPVGARAVCGAFCENNGDEQRKQIGHKRCPLCFEPAIATGKWYGVYWNEKAWVGIHLDFDSSLYGGAAFYCVEAGDLVDPAGNHFPCNMDSKFHYIFPEGSQTEFAWEKENLLK